MRESATLLQGFKYYSPEYRPFDELEVPGVSLLVAAAAAAGYYPIAEYEISKIDRSDRRKRKPGRADLWFVAGEQSYSFEFKRAWNESDSGKLLQCLEAARSDIDCIPTDESHYAFGGVVAPLINPALKSTYEEFKACDFAFVIEDDEAPNAYIYFSERRY
jgi:hypothetical protein